MNEFEIQCSSLEWSKQKEWKYQGDVRERMKGLRGTELGTPFHLLYTPLGRVKEGRIEKWHTGPSSYLTLSNMYLTMTARRVHYLSFHFSKRCSSLTSPCQSCTRLWYQGCYLIQLRLLWLYRRHFRQYRWPLHFLLLCFNTYMGIKQILLYIKSWRTFLELETVLGIFKIYNEMNVLHAVWKWPDEILSHLMRIWH